MAGERAKAEGYIHQMLERRKERYVPPYNLALVFAGLGETEKALDWLRRALEERDVHMPFLMDYKWDEMRSKTEFRRLLAKAGFAGL
jgi:hypothetical protein